MASLSHLLLLLSTCLLLLLSLTAAKGQDYYSMFDMTRDTFDKERLEKTYRRLAMRYHPDKNPGDKAAEEKFLEINKAFDILSDDHKRRVYDQHGAEAAERAQAGGAGGGHARDSEWADAFFKKMFGDMFGFGGGSGGGGGSRRGGRQQGPDAKLELQVSLADIYKGAAIKVEITRQKLCHQCKGTGAEKPDEVTTCSACKGSGVRTFYQQIGMGFVQQVQSTCDQCAGRGKKFSKPCPICSGNGLERVPEPLEIVVEPGIPDKHVVTLRGMADQHPDADAGDLHCVLHTASHHPKFDRDGAHLYTDIHLTLREALLGFKKKLKHLDDHYVEIDRTDLVTQPDEEQKIKGEGLPVFGEKGKRGNLYVQYKVTLPAAIPKEQRQILEKVLKPTEHEKDEL